MMSNDGRVYSVLVVSASEKFNSVIAMQLPEYSYSPITYANSIACARRAMLERSYDMILINTPLPDDFGTDFAIDACSKTCAAVLLVIKNDMYDDISRGALNQGVFTIAKPTPQLMLSHTVRLMSAARERLRRFERNEMKLEEKMEEIRLVNRAKWKLIADKSMTEQEAHALIGRVAMNRCITRRQVALEILDGCELDINETYTRPEIS